jgi:hypothetical protein
MGFIESILYYIVITKVYHFIVNNNNAAKFLHILKKVFFLKTYHFPVNVVMVLNNLTVRAPEKSYVKATVPRDFLYTFLFINQLHLGP